MTHMRPILRRQRNGAVAAEYPPAIEEIKRLRKQGWSFKALARRYSLPIESVKHILGESNAV